MKEYCIPKLNNFKPDIQAEILEGDMPFSVGQGAWRPIKPGEKAHPGHIIGMSATKKEMVPARLYGPEKEYIPAKLETSGAENVLPFSSSGEFDLESPIYQETSAVGR